MRTVLKLLGSFLLGVVFYVSALEYREYVYWDGVAECIKTAPANYPLPYVYQVCVSRRQAQHWMDAMVLKRPQVGFKVFIKPLVE